ncbi:putative cyclin-D6-1 [Camellia lanceoleosa]|uniref:Cyclin-D6-1 n=1 Tax=Camellia lanceoleosa TaxID=1840588 RepID=A0ACC0H8J2_9ERIC|nr:putative cyclin-D6-1 [Camellia lanceoleosa]
MEYNPYDPLLQEDEIRPFRKLFTVESSFMACEGYFQNERTISFRRYAVSYIEENSKCEDFDAFVPYLAMNYFDRFISMHKLPEVISSNKEENAILLVICCLTIAWKMRIRSFNVELFLTERNLQFNRNQVKEMELHILNSLRWRMRSLTPICFVGYFIPLLRLPRSSQQLNRRPVYQIIVRAQADIGFTQFKPSIIAASAILTASSKLFPAQFEEFKAVLSSSEFVSAEELMQCMEAMESKYKDDVALKTPTGQRTGEEPSSRVRRTSEPIDIVPVGGASRVGTVEVSSALLRAALPPGAIADEELISHRSGKELVGEEGVEIQPAATETVDKQAAASHDDDPFMNFELHWTDPNEPKVTIASVLPDLSESGPSGPTSPCSWFGGFCNCCPIFDRG